MSEQKTVRDVILKRIIYELKESWKEAATDDFFGALEDLKNYAQGLIDSTPAEPGEVYDLRAEIQKLREENARLKGAALLSIDDINLGLIDGRNHWLIQARDRLGLALNGDPSFKALGKESK